MECLISIRYLQRMVSWVVELTSSILWLLMSITPEIFRVPSKEVLALPGAHNGSIVKIPRSQNTVKKLMLAVTSPGQT